MASLLALFGPKRGVRVDVTGPVTVGRSSTAEMQLIDEKVSREHCRFTPEGDAVRVEDLGSHNGTYVNGEKLTSARTLIAGDEVAVGDSLFVFDGEVDVANARFGDATLVVSPPTKDGVVDREESQSVTTPMPPSAAPPQLAAIATLAATLASAEDAEASARALLAAMESALHPDRAFVLLWDAPRKMATPLVGKSDGSAVSISRTVLDGAAASKRAVFVDDAVESRDLKEAKSVIRHRLRSVVVAPVVAGGKVVGFLHADRKSRGAYGPADAATLEAFAGIAALHGLTGSLGVKQQQPSTRPIVHHDAPRPSGVSKSWSESLRIAESAASVNSTVLVTGESGTGKEEVARYIHLSSSRATKPFVAVNCGAIPDNLAESELFGHEKGAFTGAIGTREGKVEAADGGTLFLDEIGELSPASQVKLLRVLQERAFYRVGSTTARRVDVRVVAATHRDLEADVKSGRFREDLFYRLNVLRIHLSPLRERAEDLEPLAQTLLARVCGVIGRKNPGLGSDAFAVLKGHKWPGNARELANVLERMVVLRRVTDDSPLHRADALSALGAGPATTAQDLPDGTLAEKIAALERTEVESALRKARGVKTRAAEILGISRPTLDKKIADLGIDLWKEETAG